MWEDDRLFLGTQFSRADPQPLSCFVSLLYGQSKRNVAGLLCCIRWSMFSSFFSFRSYFTENTPTVWIMKDGFSAPLIGVLPSSCNVRGAQILQESKSHIKIVGARRVIEGFKNIRHHGTKFTRHSNLAPGICAPLLYWITCPMLNRFFGLSA